MNATILSLVSLGAAFGSVARYRIGRVIASRTNSDFPWGTWWVNMAGTLLLGIFYQEFDRYHIYAGWWALLGTGFCGAFTTFSTMSVEAVGLFRKKPMICILYLSSSLFVGLLLAWATQWV